MKRTLAASLAVAGQMKEAASATRAAAEAANSVSTDWNQFGWTSLVAGEADEQKIHAVERAAGQPVYAIQHTIASMYAEIGKVSEARKIALQALDQFGLVAPDAEWSYVFGRIAEQLGANATAIFYYQNVEPGPNPKDTLSVFLLTQRRLAVLNARP